MERVWLLPLHELEWGKVLSGEMREFLKEPLDV